ncbi:tat pathway signal sequence [Trichoderma arundinaceum]|uniref:Tat pathway signal sequence n=1 Tax=Trichoderma arundinaceum TaxID=490622 RepID=A0A395NBY6_TRIAR|nr:tat pathway signal sequence [Trichoderma arundinaceum]
MWNYGRSRLARQQRYQSVATPSDDEEFADQSVDELRALDRTKVLHARIFLAFASLCLFLSLSFFIERVSSHVSDEKCTRRMSPPSPVLEAVRYEWTTFKNFEPDVYSGYPSSASEAAWAKLWDFGAFSVPLELLGGLNKSSMTGDFRLVGEDQGGGVGGLLEGAHQIHCLVLEETKHVGTMLTIASQLYGWY